MVIPIIINVLLGLGLSVASGFRLFIPFIVINISASLGYINLPQEFSWIATSEVLAILIVAAVIEIIAYEIPWFNNLVNMFSIPFAVVAGTILTASFITGINPVYQWALALIAGGGTAFATDIFSNTSHIALTTTTAGSANPILALLESIVAVAISLIVILAITAPLVLIAIPFLVKVFRSFVRKKVRVGN